MSPREHANGLDNAGWKDMVPGAKRKHCEDGEQGSISRRNKTSDNRAQGLPCPDDLPSPLSTNSTSARKLFSYYSTTSTVTWFSQPPNVEATCAIDGFDPDAIWNAYSAIREDTDEEDKEEDESGDNELSKKRDPVIRDLPEATVHYGEIHVFKNPMTDNKAVRTSDTNGVFKLVATSSLVTEQEETLNEPELDVELEAELEAELKRMTPLLATTQLSKLPMGKKSNESAGIDGHRKPVISAEPFEGRTDVERRKDATPLTPTETITHTKPRHSHSLTSSVTYNANKNSSNQRYAPAYKEDFPDEHPQCAQFDGAVIFDSDPPTEAHAYELDEVIQPGQRKQKLDGNMSKRKEKSGGWHFKKPEHRLSAFKKAVDYRTHHRSKCKNLHWTIRMGCPSTAIEAALWASLLSSSTTKLFLKNIKKGNKATAKRVTVEIAVPNSAVAANTGFQSYIKAMQTLVEEHSDQLDIVLADESILEANPLEFYHDFDVDLDYSRLAKEDKFLSAFNTTWDNLWKEAQDQCQFANGGKTPTRDIVLHERDRRYNELVQQYKENKKETYLQQRESINECIAFCKAFVEELHRLFPGRQSLDFLGSKS